MDGCILVFGVVTEWEAGYVRVCLPTFDDIVTDWLQIVKPRAMNDDENWPLEANEEVACVVDRYCKEGVCLGALTNTQDMPDDGAAAGKWRKRFSDGMIMEYDKVAHKLTYTMNDGGIWGYNAGTGVFTMNSGGGENMYQFMKDFITCLTELTVSTGTGPSSVPVNVSVPGASGVTFTDLLTRLNNFMSA